MNTTDEYWKILDKNMDWVKVSDGKATLVLTIYGVMLSVIYSDAQYVMKLAQKSYLVLIFLALAGILALISIIYAFLCINPRLKNPNAHSIIYFGHIITRFKNPSEYLQYSEKILQDEEAYKRELSEQIYVNAHIAWKKFENVTHSIRYFFSSLVVFVAAIVINMVI